MTRKAELIFWMSTLTWAAAIWAWALTGYPTSSAIVSPLLPTDPQWAQFWASVIGLAIAIAVPAWLHTRESSERQADRLNRARANAIGMRAQLVLIEACFRHASRPKAALDDSEEDPCAAVERFQEALDVAPLPEEYMRLLGELGAASRSVHRFFDNLELARALLTVTRCELMLPDDIEDRRIQIARLAEMASTARLHIEELFR